MDSRSFINCIFHLRHSKVPRSLIFLLGITLTVPFLCLWPELTPCIQRQGVGVLLALLWWGVCFNKEKLFVLEICQFFAIFAYIEKANTGDIDIIEFDDSEISYVPVKMISHIYFFFYGYYSGGLLTYILISIVLFIYGYYERLYAIPRNKIKNSIRDKDFDALERLEFSKAGLNALQNQTLCSICINDFEEREEIIKLPICCHCFHVQCLQKWLFKQCVCPYCRSNIKKNQKTLGK